MSKNFQSGPSDVQYQLRQSYIHIGSEISRLNKLSNAIRRASRESQFHKAIDFQLTDDDGNEIGSFLFNIFEEYVNERFPEISENIRQRLVRAMIVRRKRILYRRHRQWIAAIRPDRTAPKTTTTLPLASQKTTQFSGHATQSQSRNDIISTLKDSPSIVQSVTTLDPDKFRRASSSPYMVAASEVIALDDSEDVVFPPNPGLTAKRKYEQLKNQRELEYQAEVKANAMTMEIESKFENLSKSDLEIIGEIACPYCLDALPVEAILNDREWENHVKNDLGPFVCLFDGCDQPDMLFSYSEEWRDHMNQHYKFWRCPSHRDLGPFSTQENYIEHIREVHETTLSDIQLRALANRNSRTAANPFPICPLCKANETFSQMQSHITSHLMSLALKSLPSCQKEIPEDADDNNDSVAVSTQESSITIKNVMKPKETADLTKQQIMPRHLKHNRLVSSLLFSRLPAAASLLSCTRRPGKAPKSRALPVSMNKIDEDAGPNPDIYAMFARPPDEMQPPVRPTSSVSLPISTPGAREPSPALEPLETLYLPILKVTVDVTVDGAVAITELKQSFHNPSELVIPEAQHTFPLYDGDTVTSFECRIGESRVLRGVVKPKEEARKTFEKVKKQKMEAAALFQELTPKILETSLGNIPAHTKVDVIIKYIHELKVVQVPHGTGLAVTLPTSIAPRYGNPTALAIPSILDEDSLEIVVRVVDNGHISVHDCYTESGHELSFEETTQIPQTTVPNPAELMSPQTQPQLVFKHASKTVVLKKDFIFVIQMHDTYRLGPRAVFSPADEDGRAALMVSLRPSELFSNAVRPNSFAGEVLFVLDRSGSMAWTVEGSNTLKINAMRDAMQLALSGVQDTCAFNIISFGSEVYGMWAESRLCSTDAELKKARKYVRHLRADMGGSDLLEAIRAAVNTRVQSRASTQVIILTDGEVEDEGNEPILELVWKTRKELGDKVRFFTLGIGDMVSHRLLETIAELGGGYCDVIDVVKRPHWEDRLNIMLRSAMGPDSWTCSIDLGTGFQRRSLMDLSVRANSESTPLSAPYIQAPNPIPPLHPYAYKSIFFMLDVKSRQVPDKVTIHTKTPGAKIKAQQVNVEQSRSRTIHHLAAKAVLRGMEDDVERGSAEPEPARRDGEAIGVKYSITSRWTSFVAVANDEAEKQAREMDIYQSMLKEMAIEDVLRLDTSDEESGIASTSSEPFFCEEDMSDSSEEMMNYPDPTMRDPPPVMMPLPPPAAVERGAQPRAFPGLPPPPPACVVPQMSQQMTTPKTEYEKEAKLPPVMMAPPPLAQRPPMFHTPAPPAEVAEKTTVIRDVSPARSHTTPSDTDSSTNEGVVSRDLTRHARNYLDSLSPDKVLIQSREHEPPGVQESEVRFSGMRGPQGIPGPQSCRGPANWGTPLGLDTESDADSAAGCDGDSDGDSTADSGAVAEVEETEPYQPSVVGPITWTDAVGSQCGGLFVLPDILRAKLLQHFCKGIVDWMREELARFPAFSPLPDEKKITLIDTLMMIIYFGTHLAVEEGYWYLIMDKAEDAVLLALCLDENAQGGLESEPFSAMKLSIEHIHFKKAQAEAQVERRNRDEVPAEAAAKTCPVCRESFGMAGGTKVTPKGFVCLSDECCDADGRRVWETWDSFWKHQVDRGHLLCSTGSLVDEED